MTSPLFESGYAFAVPVLIMRWLGVELPTATATKRVTVVSNDFDIIVDLLTFTGEAASNEAVEMLQRRGREQGRELVLESCEIDVASFALLVAKEPNAELLNVDETPTSGGFIQAKPMVESDMRQVEALSRFAGLHFVYCYSTTISNPPFSEKAGTVHLFCQARPPGVYNSGMVVETLFGVQVWEDGQTRLVNMPTRGRGRLIIDGVTPIFQVLGSNYYQLCLTHTAFHGEAARETIFRKLLGCMYRDLVKASDRKTEPIVETNAEDFSGFVIIQAAAILGELQTTLERINALIRSEENELADKLHDQKVLAVLLEAMQVTSADIQDAEDKLADESRKQQLFTLRVKTMQDSEFVRGLHKRLPMELDEITKMDGVAAVRIVDSGVHIVTTDIILEDNGRRYNLGPFTIRLDPNGKIGVWSEAPRHSLGHHHPHVSRISLACFGNATVAIAKYMSEFRFAEAALVVMRWLNTYTPETTLHPLEEWLAEPDERR
ncbi:MAG: hypothetical protein Q7R85_02005 [bacterium]|nr:hypothetical protein [bacterium]